MPVDEAITQWIEQLREGDSDAAEKLSASGVDVMVFLPGDVPLVTVEELEIVRLENLVARVRCDFNGDTACDNADIDLLGKEIIAGTNNSDFDLTNDGVVNLADQDEWRAIAATKNGFAAPYLNGDADLDGSVLSSDLNAVALNWRGTPDPWSDGDFNADGIVDAGDLNLLALNWQESVPLAAAGEAVPEPSSLVLFMVAGFALMIRRR